LVQRTGEGERFGGKRSKSKQIKKKTEINFYRREIQSMKTDAGVTGEGYEGP